MHYRRVWVFAFLFTLTAINYADRVALSVAAKPISTDFHLSPVQLGDLLSSTLTMTRRPITADTSLRLTPVPAT